MDANNVIQFPTRSEIPRTKDEVKVALDSFREEYFDTISQELANEMFMRLSLMGFDLLDRHTIKDCYLVIESIKSLLMKSKNLFNPMQELADVMMFIPGEETEDLVDNLDE